MTTTPALSPEVAERVHHAKEPVSPVAGPYGHPFHPIPIGAWVSSLTFDIATRVNNDGSKPLTDATYWLIGIGILGALLAALFGLMDLIRVPRRTKALRFGLAHMALNLAVVGLYIGNFAWRHDSYYEAVRVKTGQLVLSAVAIGLLLVSGWLGGMLAYRYGVRVADESTTQAEGYS